MISNELKKTLKFWGIAVLVVILINVLILGVGIFINSHKPLEPCKIPGGAKARIATE